MSNTNTLPTVRITAATLSADDSLVTRSTWGMERLVMPVMDIEVERNPGSGLGTVDWIVVTVQHPSGNEVTVRVSPNTVFHVLAAEGVRA